MPVFQVARVSELSENVPTDAKAGEVDLVLVKQGNVVHALDGHCPHKGVPMSKGAVEGSRIICGIHRAAFDLASGALLSPPACEALRRYQVKIEGEDVLVTLPEDTEKWPVPAMASKGSDDRHFVVVGNGAAGWWGAETLRRQGYEGRLTVVTSDQVEPYDRTDLSKGFLGPDSDPQPTILRANAILEAHDIDIVQATATGLDTGGKKLLLEGAAEPISYDQLLIATGSGARSLPIEGVELEGVHSIRSLGDAQAFRADLDRVAQKGAISVVIIGGGFIGLEAAAALGKRDDVDISIIMQEEAPMAGLFGEAFAARLKSEHEAAGVRFYPSASVSGISGTYRAESVVLEDGTTLKADIVLMAVGAKPRTDWLPFETDRDGGITVGEDLSVPGAEGVFLAGDIARIPTAWGDVRIEHWRFAQETGEVAARNMLGQGTTYQSTPFFWSMQQIAGSYTLTGHVSGWDAIDGDVSPDDFQASFVKDGKVSAVLAHGLGEQLTRLERKMAGKGPLPPEDAN